MTYEPSPGGVLMIRAWRDPDGDLQIRLTEVIEGPAGTEAALDVTSVPTDNDALAAVRAWLDRLRGGE